VLLGITSITFFLINAMPGSPVEVMLGPTATEEMITEASARYGFDQPSTFATTKYILAVLGGDLGQSIHYGVPVTEKILERLPVTILLLVSSFTFAISVAIPLGIVSARRRNQPIDHGSRVVSLIGVSTPNFWIGLLLIIVFGYHPSAPLERVSDAVRDLGSRGRGLAAPTSWSKPGGASSCLPSRWGLSKWRPSPHRALLDVGGARAGLHQPRQSVRR